MRYLLATAVAAYSLMTVAAFAAGNDGSWYAGASGDVTFPQNSTVTGTTNGNVKYGFSSGGNVALGYQPRALSSSLGDVRLEVEGGYHALGLKDVTAGGVTNTNPSGDFKVATLMGNAYYDFHTNSQFTPYIGAGIGEAHVSFNKNNGFGMTSSSDDELGYQLMTGVSYTPKSMPQTDWSIGYRYLGTTSPKFNTTTGNVKFDSIQASNVELGFKYHF